ncbi:diguanylate cyclase [Vibrio genomosp. F6]|uniref:GGDEF domain-containing protein n=1 Tax=Vibrio genomosp. F6 TaxID=723172 RepID=UPI0010BD0C07|nr:GGDEF domain-containing protein [Vibrio genomosp. F6]TKF21779.1 diguanylate cyclase [Vibrio genomosp. F6]
MPKPRKLKTLAFYLISSLLLSVSLYAQANEPLPIPLFFADKITAQNEAIFSIYQLADSEPEVARKMLSQISLASIEEKDNLKQALYYLTLFRLEGALGSTDMWQEDKYSGDHVARLDSLGERLDQAWMQGEAELERIIEFIEIGYYDEALRRVETVIEIAKQAEYWHLLARATKWRANLYVELSDYPKAMEDYRTALDIFTQQKDILQQARVLSNISTVYFRLEEWGQADKYSRRAFSLVEHSHFNNPSVKVMLHINAGIIAKNLDNKALESEHFRAAVKLSTEKGSRYSQIYALANLVTLLIQENQIDEAIVSAQRCLTLAEEVSDRAGLMYCNEAVAETYLKQKRFDEALALAEKVFAQFDAANNRIKAISMKAFIAKIHEDKSDYKEALVLYKEYANERNDYLFDERRKELFALQENYEAKYKENEIELLKYENALNSARLSQQKMLDKLWVSVLLIFCLVIYILFRRYISVSKTNFRLRRSNETLTSQSLEDPLTGLHNRRYLEQWLEKAAQNNQLAAYDLVVLVADVDHFKKVNDIYGHDVGDVVLTEVARRLNENARSDNDLLVRWGGEEFVLVLAVSPESDAELVLNRLRESISVTPIICANHELTVTISIGAFGKIKYGEIHKRWNEILSKSDEALYDAKLSGRNRVKLVTDN